MQTTFFSFERFLKNLADDLYSSIPKGSIYHIKHVKHTTFYYSSGLNKIMFNGSIYYILHLQILRFYLVRQLQTSTRALITDEISNIICILG